VNQKKGKRVCLLTGSCICSECCGANRKQEVCHACSYYKAPKRNYKDIPCYTPEELQRNEDRLKTSMIIEAAISNYDAKTNDIIRDELAIHLLELLLDVHFFQREHEPSEDSMLEAGYSYVTNAITTELAMIQREELAKILATIYFLAKRRSSGSREYLSFVRNYVQITSVKCGLCGSAEKGLTRTPCCGNWICDDEDSYGTFSFERNSCYRNHSKYTVCSNHFESRHKGPWQECQKCKDEIILPYYVEMGTNEHNFVVLENPEQVQIRCVNCDFVGSSINEFSYTTSKGFYCLQEWCAEAATGGAVGM